MQQMQNAPRPYSVGPGGVINGPPQGGMRPLGPPGPVGPPNARGQIPSGATGNPYGPGVAHQMPAGPPVSMNQPPVGLKAGPVPPNMPSGPSSLGPPSNTPNGHAPPINAPQAMNGAPPPGSQPINSNQGPPFMTGYPPGQYNSSSVPSVNNSQQINTTQTSQFPPVSSSNGQNPTVAPFTGPTMAGRGGPPIQSMPHSQPPIPSNGPTQPGISSPTRPPPPGALSSPSQFQQAQFSQRPGDVPQLPNRPQMPGMPPMPPTFSGGPTGMTPMPGQMMPPPPMNGPGGIRPPGMGPMPPNSMGGYPSSSTGINTASSMASPGMPPGAGNRGGRLDPDQMPSPITVMDEDQKANGGNFDTKEKGLTPPLVTTKFTVNDYGNASPRYIRSTMYHVPATEDIRKQSGVPFGLVLSPLARAQQGENEPPISDFGPSGPVRCMRCKAYMSPMMQFIDGGRRFQCAFCKATSEVPQEYFQHLDHQGQRLDKYQRPELCLGTYECLATKDYCRDSKEPQPPGIIFAIDVSYPMMKEGVVQLICANMKNILKENLPKDTNCDQSKMRVGFMTYNSKIHFYNINGAKLSQPQQMTVGDVHDMFVPLADGLLSSLEDSEAVIDILMEQIPQMFADTRETETVLGPVIQAGKEAFKAAECAGKLIVFHHNLPVADAPGKLKNRDDRKVLGTDKEKAVLTPQSKDYNQFGQECVRVGCSVDLFLFNNAYIDIATISQVSRLTGGQLYKYTYFQQEMDGKRFLADLASNLSRPIVFDAIMRVRTSTGVRPVEFYGSFYMENTTDTELASLNSDSAIACEIKYDDKLTDEDGVYIQAALLFTSVSGQRRLRVINLALNCGTSMADMYRNCELDTIVNFTAKQSIARLMENNPKTVKEALVNNCAQILACYRKNCASPSSAGQLILPECMKLLPLYTNCLLKSDALSGGADVGCDDRAFLMNTISSMDIGATVAFFYPRLLPLHDISTAEDHVTDIPGPIRCTIEKVNENGVYLLDNGIYLFLYVGLAAEPSFIQDIFGVSTAAQINVEMPHLEERDNPTSQKVRKVIEIVRKQRTRQYMRLVIVRQRDKLDILFRHYLCEDRAGQGTSASGSDSNFSYVDFLCHMHKEIRALLG